MGSVSSAEALAISLASQCDRGKVCEDNQGAVRHISTSLGDLLIVADGLGSPLADLTLPDVHAAHARMCGERNERRRQRSQIPIGESAKSGLAKKGPKFD